MHLLKFIFLTFLVNCVFCKTHTKSLTESMGQEVIEIGAPIKELPQEVEEEPSAEDDEKHIISTVQAATKKEFVKTATINPSKKVKDIDKIDGKKHEDDEARIEKELADIYKDSLDYKADSAEVTKEGNVVTSSEKIATVYVTPMETEKSVERAGMQQFKLVPDSTRPRDIARFRTSVDEINCRYMMSATKTLPSDTNKSEAGKNGKMLEFVLILWTPLLYTIFI